MRLITLPFVLLVLFFCGAVVAKPVIEQKYKYYYVKTDNQRALLPTLNKMSPIKEGGKTFHGYLKSNIDWRFKWKEGDYGCEISQVSTKVTVLYTLPKLQSTNTIVNAIWKTWYPKLVKHEDGHKANAINVANKIETDINMLPKASNCKQLEKAANAVGHRWIAELNKLDANYDRDTKHGETQGANIRQYLK